MPFGLVDLSLTLNQAVCFRLYQVPRVARADYIVIDRHRFEYLNALQKPNCVYCGYVNGLIAYAREIASRTGDCEGAAPGAPERSHPRIVAQHRSAALIGAQA